MSNTNRETANCRHCQRPIEFDQTDGWVDPEATGDDSVWRETCDEHDTFEARHEPKTYRIVRFFQDDNKAEEVVVRGLTLEQAKAHCQRDDSRGDDWFDGFREES